MKPVAAFPLLLAVVAAGCSESGAVVPVGGESDHSSSIAVSADASTLYVVNPDADSVSILDAQTGAILHEILLAATPPQIDSDAQYYPAVEPRALALGPGQTTLYVTGHRSGKLYVINAATGAVEQSAAVCPEPVGVLVSPFGNTVYVACSVDAAILSLDATTLAVTSSVPVDRKPWTLAWSPNRQTIYATHLLGPGVSVLSPSPLALEGIWTLADGPTGSAPTVPHGPVRGIYDVLPRPGTSETWIAHMMLGIDTPQPTLVFDMTDFTSISVLDAGKQLARLVLSTTPGDGGAFGDVTSGPHALAFSSDGSLAFMADTGSEDVLVVDAQQRVEATLVRPLPGHQPEGIAAGSDGRVYVDERNTSDVAVLTVATGPFGPSVTVAGAFKRVTADPMPGALRLGQHVFNSANSDELPLTTDHWVSCATCHLEGRSDAVTWQFVQGPRDTPSNAGGVTQTGFLFRTAARNDVTDYWRTINTEQGGHFSTTVPLLENDLQALEEYVNHAIPYPQPPSGLDPTTVARGQSLFASLGCATCHSGPAFTDSGSGNPGLDLAGPVVSTPTPGGVVLHDVGTCVTSGTYVDVATPDENGDARTACAFDTPTLLGIADSGPYLHDGSAATLEDVFTQAPGMVGQAATKLSPSDLAAIVAYLRSL